MATHFSILAWRIPWMEEPGGPQSIGSQRVGQGTKTQTSLVLHVPFHQRFAPALTLQLKKAAWCNERETE